MTVINPNSISGITSITLPSGDGNVLTIHTNDGVERFRIDSSGNVKVGSACTISQDGDVFFTGVCTATTLTGAASGLTGALPAISGANLTNLPAANLTGTLPAISGANLTGIAATDNVRTGILDVAGIATFRNDVKIGAAVTISESGIEASGIGITVSNINGQQISGRRNLIINGEMNISERQGTTSTAVTNENEYVLDRWYVGTASGGGTSLNVQQVHGNPTGAPYGYAASMKMTVAVADDGGSDSFNVVQTRIENLDSNWLAFGTSQAKTVTLQFYVKSSLTGTFGGSLVAGDFSKGYVFQYAISSADTWEKKVITIPGDTASTADSVYNRGTATSARGLVLYFDLGSGSNSEKSAANDWTATATWGYAARISGNVKLCANAGADWSLTGVQLEVGSQATEFEHRSFGDELTLCQRYCYVVIRHDGSMSGAKALGGSGSFYTGNTPYMNMDFPVTMRAAPTMDCVNKTNAFQFPSGGSGHNAPTLELIHATTNCCTLHGTTTSSAGGGDTSNPYFNANNTTTSDSVIIDAEL